MNSHGGTLYKDTIVQLVQTLKTAMKKYLKQYGSSINEKVNYVKLMNVNKKCWKNNFEIIYVFGHTVGIKFLT